MICEFKRHERSSPVSDVLWKLLENCITTLVFVFQEEGTEVWRVDFLGENRVYANPLNEYKSCSWLLKEVTAWVCVWTARLWIQKSYLSG